MQLIKTNVSLKNKNWFCTGGNSQYYSEPTTIEECKEVLQFVQQKDIPCFILGLGANVLISDEGFNGLTVHPKLTDCFISHEEQENVYVTAGAGVTMEHIINWCLDNSILGLEEFSGIPSTVGGALYINLHYFKFFISYFLYSAQVMEIKTGKIFSVNTDWFEYGYDSSKLFSKNFLLLQATFKLKKCTELEAAYAKGRSTEIIRHRKARYPHKNTCGSFFRNFYEHEVSLESNGKKLIFAGYYLDQVGVKGHLKIGDTGVSHQHANMIVTGPHATSKEVIQVAHTMQSKVLEKYGLLLQPECELIGFKEYPLYKH